MSTFENPQLTGTLVCLMFICKKLADKPLSSILPKYYILRFKTKVTFEHNLRYETKGTFGEISLKPRQMNWNVAKNNVNVVADELPSQSTNNLHLFNN
jgi:hypothetical protein